MPHSITSRAAALTAAATILTLLAGCSPSPEPSAPTAAAPEPSASVPSSATPITEPMTVASGLEAPWSIAFHAGATIISERDSGRILTVGDDGSTAELTVVGDVAAAGEGGLLGIAVHADHLYAYLTADGENRIIRYPLAGESGALEVGAAETILDGIPAATYHNGGRIAFGPDGMLYATTGDAFDSDNAQDPDSLAGKILRITPDGSVPSDNPFDGSYVYSLGHRNPQGLGWDSNGTLYASEFGQDTWDELNVIEPGGNYGWPTVEGTSGDRRFIDPVQQWRPADASPSGMTVTAGSIWIAHLRGQSIRRIPLDDLGASEVRYLGEFGRMRDVVTGPDGGLWALTSNTDGTGTPRDGDDRLLAIPVP